MPTQRITKELVIQAAFELARDGEEILVKSIATKLGTSVQPIYSYCKNMECLKQDVILVTESYLNDYVRAHLDRDNLFESMGICHAMFAKEYPHLYRLYFLRKREHIRSFAHLYEKETNPQVSQLLAKEKNISLEEAKSLHLQMMIFNIGISFVLTTLGKETDIHEVTQLLRQAHDAFTAKGEHP